MLDRAADVTWTSWQHVCWRLLNKSMRKARHSATTVAVQCDESEWESARTHTHTRNRTNINTCLSSFWAIFQCAISSAERPQSRLWNLNLWQHGRYRNYRWQHTHTLTHAHWVRSRLCTQNLNIDDLLYTDTHWHTGKRVFPFKPSLSNLFFWLLTLWKSFLLQANSTSF